MGIITQKAHKTQKARGKQETQKAQKAQKTQKARGKQETQKAHKTQKAQKSQHHSPRVFCGHVFSVLLCLNDRMYWRWLIFTVMFSLGLYFGGLIIVGWQTNTAIKMGDWSAVATHSHRMKILTGWVPHWCGECREPWLTNRLLFPFIVYYFAGDWLENSAQVILEAKTLIKALAAYQASDLRLEWLTLIGRFDPTLTRTLAFHQRLQNYGWNEPFHWLVGAETWTRYQQSLSFLVKNQNLIRSGFEFLPQQLGLLDDKSHTYTVLFQNDRELRPTGGFMGSYAQISIQHGVLAPLLVQDIYVPDGAIVGHVNPPPPIQEAFKQGFWRLRDSNWEPDFIQAVETIRWFFKKGNVEVGEGIIALNFSVIEDILTIIGPMSLPEYNQHLDSGNLYTFMQTQVETEFFPGSTQKRDVLKQVTTAVGQSFQHLSPVQFGQLVTRLETHLDQKNIQGWFQDPAIENWIDARGWSGTVTDGREHLDSVFIVDSNLSANKSNCCVTRQVHQNIQADGPDYHETLILDYSNDSPYERPRPPDFWGGDYRNYLRIYLPLSSRIVSIQIDGRPIETGVTLAAWPERSRYWVGFFVPVLHQTTRQVMIRYTVPKLHGRDYDLLIEKQSGISYWHTVTYESESGVQETKRWIESNQVVEF